MPEDTIAIPNAPHWLNHSHVLVKEDLLAEDQEWITNQVNTVVNPGTQFARVETRVGSANILLVKRMVVQGVIAVKRSKDRIKTVQLPQETEQLLAQDLDYLVTQINKLNEPMNEEEQADFLPAANGHAEANLQMVK